jgi:hypothetical protein
MDQSEATLVLADIATAKRKTLQLKGYAANGSILIAWGLAWLGGNLASQFSPSASPFLWGLGWAGALFWTATRPRQSGDGRVWATWLALVGFAALMIALLRADVPAASMMASLVVAAAYVILGIWAGHRFTVLGAALTVLIVIAWTLFPAWLFLCLGLGGGGVLILGGVWLRRA